jgi:hypothetical protein
VIEILKTLFGGDEKIPSAGEIKRIAQLIVASRREQRELGAVAMRERELLANRSQRVKDALAMEIELAEKGSANFDETSHPYSALRDAYCGNVGRSDFDPHNNPAHDWSEYRDRNSDPREGRPGGN